jgi:hypothetical protein
LTSTLALSGTEVLPPPPCLPPPGFFFGGFAMTVAGFAAFGRVFEASVLAWAVTPPELILGRSTNTVMTYAMTGMRTTLRMSGNIALMPPPAGAAPSAGLGASAFLSDIIQCNA